MAVVIPCWRISVSFVRHYGLVLHGCYPGKSQMAATAEDKKCLQEMMDNDRLTLVQPEGHHSHNAMQQRSLWREVFTPIVLMYTRWPCLPLLMQQRH